MSFHYYIQNDREFVIVLILSLVASVTVAVIASVIEKRRSKGKRR